MWNRITRLVVFLNRLGFLPGFFPFAILLLYSRTAASYTSTLRVSKAPKKETKPLSKISSSSVFVYERLPLTAITMSCACAMALASGTCILSGNMESGNGPMTCGNNIITVTLSVADMPTSVKIDRWRLVVTPWHTNLRAQTTASLWSRIRRWLFS